MFLRIPKFEYHLLCMVHSFGLITSTMNIAVKIESNESLKKTDYKTKIYNKIEWNRNR